MSAEAQDLGFALSDIVGDSTATVADKLAAIQALSDKRTLALREQTRRIRAEHEAAKAHADGSFKAILANFNAVHELPTLVQMPSGSLATATGDALVETQSLVDTKAAKERAKIERCFRIFDSDGSGFIDAKEFQALAFSLGETMTEEEARHGISQIDTNYDGRVSLPEFAAWWLSSSRVSGSKAGFASASRKVQSVKLKLATHEYKHRTKAAVHSVHRTSISASSSKRAAAASDGSSSRSATMSKPSQPPPNIEAKVNITAGRIDDAEPHEIATVAAEIRTDVGAAAALRNVLGLSHDAPAVVLSLSLPVVDGADPDDVAALIQAVTDLGNVAYDAEILPAPVKVALESDETGQRFVRLAVAVEDEDGDLEEIEMALGAYATADIETATAELSFSPAPKVAMSARIPSALPAGVKLSGNLVAARSLVDMIEMALDDQLALSEDAGLGHPLLLALQRLRTCQLDMRYKGSVEKLTREELEALFGDEGAIAEQLVDVLRADNMYTKLTAMLTDILTPMFESLLEEMEVANEPVDTEFYDDYEPSEESDVAGRIGLLFEIYRGTAHLLEGISEASLMLNDVWLEVKFTNLPLFAVLPSPATLGIPDDFGARGDASDEEESDSDGQLELDVPLVFVLGVKNSGKTTQCARIRTEFGFTVLTVDDAAAAYNTSGANTGKGTNAAALSPTQLAEGFRLCALTAVADNTTGFLIDGYPNTPEECAALTQAVGNPSFVYHMRIADAVAAARLRPEHAELSPDSLLEVAQETNERFETQTAALLSAFRRAELLLEIVSNDAEDVVYKSMRTGLKMLCGVDAVEGYVAPDADPVLDITGRLSRMSFVGLPALTRFAKASVLVVGCGALGAEAAKNIVLCNVGRVSMSDPGSPAVTVADTGANFFVGSEDVGKSRARTVAARLALLNPSVEVDVVTSDVTAELVAEYNVVIVANQPGSAALQLNEYCRIADVAFVRVGAWGLFGSLFVDGGPTRVVAEPAPHRPDTYYVTGITNANPGVVTLNYDDGVHGLSTGDFVVFSGVEGMEELNTSQPHKVTVVNAHTFSIEDTRAYGEYVRGGAVTVHYEPEVMHFEPLGDMLAKCERFVRIDGATDHSETLHIAYQALEVFMSSKGRLPEPGSESDANHLVASSAEVNMLRGSPVEWGPGCNDVVRKLAHGASTTLAPVVCIVGGLAAFEVFSLAASKFRPLHQMCHVDFSACLPAGWPLPPESYAPQGSRYDDQVSVFGGTFQDRLFAQNVLVAGAGGVGSEFIRLAALMGVGASPLGSLTVVDDDTVSVSTQGRCVLAATAGVGESKVAVAAEGVADIIPLKTKCVKFSDETAHSFGRKWIENLTAIVVCVDSVDARLAVDSLSIRHAVPMLESGVEGVKGHTSVSLPGLTEHYGAAPPPPDTNFAPKTRSFPYKPSECIGWAHEQFSMLCGKVVGALVEYAAADSVDDYIGQATGRNASDALALSDLFAGTHSGSVWGAAALAGLRDWDDCVVWATKALAELFVLHPQQVLTAFPLNMPSDGSDGATLFWSAPKHPPAVLALSLDDVITVQAIAAAAGVVAACLRLRVPDGRDDACDSVTSIVDALLEGVVRDVAATAAAAAAETNTPTSPTTPTATHSYAVSRRGGDGRNAADVAREKLASVLAGMPTPRALRARGFVVESVEFDLFEPTGFHFMFVESFARLRARMYSIDGVTTEGVVEYVSGAAPSLPMSTSLVAGFMALEVYKLVLKHPVDEYRHVYFNLAVPVLTESEPAPPHKFVTHTRTIAPDPVNHPDYVEETEVVAVPEGHTVWDSVVVDMNDPTIQQLIDYFGRKYNITLVSVAVGASLVYNAFIPAHKKRMDSKVSALAVGKRHDVADALENGGDIEIMCTFEQDEKEVDFPRVYIKFAPQTA